MTIGGCAVGGGAVGGQAVGGGPVGGGVIIPSFVYPPDRIAHYPMTSVENTLGANMVNNDGIFIPDPAEVRGTVWQGNGSSDYLSSFLGNGGGQYWSGSIWYNYNTVSNIIFGDSGTLNYVWQQSATQISVNIDGSFKVFTIAEQFAALWYLLGVTLEDKGSTIESNIFINGIPSVSNPISHPKPSVPGFSELGRIGSGLYMDGEFSISNSSTALWTADDFLAITNHEFIAA